MKFHSFVIALTLIVGISAAQAGNDQRVAHNNLLDFDLTALTQANKPTWRVPSAMARGDAKTVFVHRTLTALDGGYVLAAVYAWQDGAWQPAGWRMMHPSIARKWSGEKVLRNASELPGKTFSVISISDDEFYLNSENFCTDSPDTNGPDNTFGHQVGDTASYSWTNPFQGPQGCQYETEYEVQPIGNGSIGWVVIDFRFTLVSDDGGGDGPDNDEK
jgi:hypothetical protein